VAGTCFVGNIGPGGGIVFYVNPVDTPGSNYMEAATADLTAIAWCSITGTAITGTFGTAIGTGNANTNLMVAVGACTSGAANSARAYAGGGLTNWFLPSKDELAQLYTQRAVVGGFAAVYYWSSSQGGASNAWDLNVGNGVQTNVVKGYILSVRPVRAF
jgi:hypothetical protein